MKIFLLHYSNVINQQTVSSDRALARPCALRTYYACSIHPLLQICGRCAIELVRTIVCVKENFRILYQYSNATRGDEILLVLLLINFIFSFSNF